VCPCFKIRRASVLLRQRTLTCIKDDYAILPSSSPFPNLHNQPQRREWQSSVQVSSTLFIVYRTSISLKSQNNKSQGSRPRHSSTDNNNDQYIYPTIPIRTTLIRIIPISAPVKQMREEGACLWRYATHRNVSVSCNPTLPV
jgi:hypothetical protein